MTHRRHRWYLLVAVVLAGGLILISRRHPAPPAPPPLESSPAPAPSAPPAAPPSSRPAPARAAEPTAAVPDDEAPTMARIRDAVRPRPDDALAWLDALDRSHPGASGALAEERAALRVDALVAAQRIGLARDAAEEFLRRYPHSQRAEHIEALTGVHPHPTDPSE